MLLEPLDPNQRFRMRRHQARRRRAIRRISALGVVAVVAAGLAIGARSLTEDRPSQESARTGVEGEDAGAAEPKPPEPRPYPAEVRGVHVTMALASIPGKLAEYVRLADYGLNTIQLDVKDENGEVAFPSAQAPLARKIGAARPYYDPREAVALAHRHGLYVIGRVVVFEDPVLSEERPGLAIHNRNGGIWRNHAGLGWTNPYDKRVWHYNLDVAGAAARAGFDEIMFDYVRFPSDGDIGAIAYPKKVAERKIETIARFLAYARKRLQPTGARVGAAVFGLAATRNLGIGQAPHRLAVHLDAIHPMVYPSHYGSGEYDLDDPAARPGETVAASLKDFRRSLRGSPARLIPWLQDFSLGRTYSLADVMAQIRAARRFRSEGFLLWNAGGVYTPEALNAK